MKVEVKDGIPLNTKSVADLRKLPDWSSDWVVIPFVRDPWNTARVEQQGRRRLEETGWKAIPRTPDTPPSVLKAPVSPAGAFHLGADAAGSGP